MVQNLLLGTLLMALTVLVHMAGLVLMARLTPVMAKRLGFHAHDTGRAIVMTGSVLGLFLLHTIEVWIWAAVFDGIGAVQDFAGALELSTAMFSTLGYDGTEAIAHHWRLLTALEGINGFLLIGWSTAYLVGVATRHGPFRGGEHF